MMYSRSLLILALIACAGVLPARGVRFLNSHNFEHDTQAATGQTTGIWLIRFCAPTVAACGAMQQEWEALAEALTEEDIPIFAADVDAAASPDVATRFSVPSLPFYIMLRNRKVYTKRGTVGLEELKHWAVQGWEGDLPAAVPSERGSGSGGGFDPLAAVKKAARAMYERFQALLVLTRSQDKGVALQARAQLALPVLLSCLAGLLVMLARAPARGGRPPRPKRD